MTPAAAAAPPSPPAGHAGRHSWLTRNVRTLAGVSFLQDGASELLYPVLPIFLTVTLGAPVAVVGVGGGCRGDRRRHEAAGGPAR